MKKILDLSSRSVAIGSMLIMAFAVVGCDDSSSASAGQNDEAVVELSSSSSGKVTEPAEVTSSSSEKAKSSSSDAQSDAKQSSSSEKSGMSSCSTDDASSSSVKSESSSSVETPKSSSSGETSVSSSSSADVQSSSSETAVNSSSSVSGASSSSLNFDWSLPKETYLNPEIEYDTIIDSRDGKVYKTVKIGDQTWMAENLNFDPGQGGSGDNKYVWSWCYNNEPKNCDVAGRLYTWAAAMDSTGMWSTNGKGCGYGIECAPTYPVRGICPTGWHLPVHAEWSALINAVGGYSSSWGSALKSQTGWINNGNGTDAFGFSAMPVAGWGRDDDIFGHAGDAVDFWSASEFNSYMAYDMVLNDDYESQGSADKDRVQSVRCVKD